jgi:tungstate transport system permease protein
MNMLNGLIAPLQLAFSVDPRIIEITLRSLYVSGSATVIAALWGIPIATIIAMKNFHGKFLIKTIFNSLIGIPTVALGFLLFLTFSRETGPLGFLHLLYTPTAIIIGEAILITPIIVSLATTAIEAVDPEIANLARTLGASESQASFAVLKEALEGILLAGIASFNRAVGELGIAQFVGGFILGQTELLTTGIWIELQIGNPGTSIALTIILLSMVFTINLVLNLIQKMRGREWKQLLYSRT